MTSFAAKKKRACSHNKTHRGTNNTQHMATIVVDVPTLLATSTSLMPSKVKITHRGEAQHSTARTDDGDGDGGDEDNNKQRQKQQRQQRRRIPRWDPIPTSTGGSNGGDDNGDGDGGSRGLGASMWELTGAPRVLPPHISAEQEGAMVVRVRLEEIACVLAANAAAVASGAPLPALGPRTRSPSPPPVYDRDGRRTNTREQRVRERLVRERGVLCDVAARMVPAGAFRPPADVAVARAAGAPPRYAMKVFVPEKLYPQYNFIGLILGPRGNTQKRLERESGAKVSIRGKGSMKEGRSKKSSSSTQQQQQQQQQLSISTPSDEDEPLHVLIVAETEDSMNKAFNMVKPLLMPVDDGKNEWKKAQLRELAEINGTLRVATWIAPAQQQVFDAGVWCAICGDQGHPTCDCPLKGMDGVVVPSGSAAPGGGGGVPVPKRRRMESEFDSFMAEIGETPKPPPPQQQQQPATTKAAEDVFMEFMAAIDEPITTTDKQSQQQSLVGGEGGPPVPPTPVPADQLPPAPPPPGMCSIPSTRGPVYPW
jgi:splicing factor 1